MYISPYGSVKLQVEVSDAAVRTVFEIDCGFCKYTTDFLDPQRPQHVAQIHLQEQLK